MSDRDGVLGLADFVSALRVELAVAQQRAYDDAGLLKLQVGPVELELEVGFTLEKSGEANAGVKVKFWVFELGEAGVKGSLTSERMNTQRVKVTLTPRLEWRSADAAGIVSTWTAPVDVESRIGATEDGAGSLPARPGQ